jgi:hypothetical protein
LYRFSIIAIAVSIEIAIKKSQHLSITDSKQVSIKGKFMIFSRLIWLLVNLELNLTLLLFPVSINIAIN